MSGNSSPHRRRVRARGSPGRSHGGDQDRTRRRSRHRLRSPSTARSTHKVRSTDTVPEMIANIIERLNNLEDDTRNPNSSTTLTSNISSVKSTAKHGIEERRVSYTPSGTPPCNLERKSSESANSLKIDALLTDSPPRRRSDVLSDAFSSALRSINTVVRSNQPYYVSNFDPSLHNFDVWCQEVDRAKNVNNWNDNECFSRIGNCLKGDARAWLDEWVSSDRSWGNFKKEFMSLCPRKVAVADILFEVMNTNSDNYSTYADYARRSLLRLRIVTGLSDELISAIIIRGIADPQIRAAATNANLKPDELVKFFSNYVKLCPSLPTNANQAPSTSFFRRNNSNTQSSHDYNRKSKCFSCGKSGHIVANCYKRRKVNSSNSNSPPPTQTSSNAITSSNVKAECSFCKKNGHDVSTCFARLRSESRYKK